MQPLGETGIFGETSEDWATMWAYAFSTFLVLSVGLAVTRIVHRAYTQDSEIKTALKKRFGGLFDKNEDKKETADDLKEKFVGSKDTVDKVVWGQDDIEKQQDANLISLDQECTVDINLMDECKSTS